MADKLINAESLKLSTAPEKVIERWREHSSWTLSQVFHSFIDDAPTVQVKPASDGKPVEKDPKATSNILLDGSEERVGARLNSTDLISLTKPAPVFVKTYSGGSYTGKYWALCKHGVFLTMDGSISSHSVLSTRKAGTDVATFLYKTEKTPTGIEGYLIPPSELYSIKTPYPVKLLKDEKGIPFWGLLSKGLVIFFSDDFRKAEGQKIDTRLANFKTEIYTIGTLRSKGYTIQYDNYLVTPDWNKEGEIEFVEKHQEVALGEPDDAKDGGSYSSVITW